LQKERYKLEETRAAAAEPQKGLEPERMLLLFSNRALLWFDEGDADIRRSILQIASSNLLLKDKNLSIKAKNPFTTVPSEPKNPNQQGELNDVRTLPLGQIRQVIPFSAIYSAIGKTRSSKR
jgi:hypothetical protein